MKTFFNLAFCYIVYSTDSKMTIEFFINHLKPMFVHNNALLIVLLFGFLIIGRLALG